MEVKHRVAAIPVESGDSLRGGEAEASRERKSGTPETSEAP
jgi:hypothetical protein